MAVNPQICIYISMKLYQIPHFNDAYVKNKSIFEYRKFLEPHEGLRFFRDFVTI